MNDKLLEISKLNVYCPSSGIGKEDLRILNNISIDLHENEILGLVGESGSGKSVLINAIGRNLEPPLWSEEDKVLLSIDGAIRNIRDNTEDEMRRIWGKTIAFIPTTAKDRFNPILTVGRQFIDILQSSLKISSDEAYEKVIEMFRLVRMPDAQHNFNNYIHELSGGMAQRVLLSIAFSMSPKIILADELTMGLDLTIQRQVLDIMMNLVLKAKSSVILATRDLGIVAHYCNRVAVLKKGELVELAQVKELFGNPRHPHSYELLEASFASFGGKHIGNNEKRNTLGGKRASAESKKNITVQNAARKLLTVEQLNKHFPMKRKGYSVCAVNDVSFSVLEGQTLGLVGESGCGKTTVGKCIVGLLKPTSGQIVYNGGDIAKSSRRRSKYLESEIQIIFQEPYDSLNPRKVVEKILEDPLIAQAKSTKLERERRIKKVLDMVELDGEYLNKYPIELTQGEQQRIGIARAFINDPKLVVLDEPTSLLDIHFRAEIVNLLRRIQSENNTAYLFITHDLVVVSQLSHRIAVMYLGRIVEEGPVERVFDNPTHPYTKALLGAALFPDPEIEREELLLKGEVPSPVNLSNSQCNLAARCSFCVEKCHNSLPQLTEVENDHFVACYKA